jgi:hypothetical protein
MLKAMGGNCERRFMCRQKSADFGRRSQEESGNEVDEGSEAFVGLLVARRNASKGFYTAEEVFDEMPPLVFFSVMFGISAGPLAERNDGLHVVGAQPFAQTAAIKSLIASAARVSGRPGCW